jgi:hypothetical protein
MECMFVRETHKGRGRGGGGEREREGHHSMDGRFGDGGREMLQNTTTPTTNTTRQLLGQWRREGMLLSTAGRPDSRGEG